MVGRLNSVKKTDINKPKRHIMTSLGFSGLLQLNQLHTNFRTKGSADISATIPLKVSNGFGVRCAIEAEMGKDRIRPEQLE